MNLLPAWLQLLCLSCWLIVAFFISACYVVGMLMPPPLQLANVNAHIAASLILILILSSLVKQLLPFQHQLILAFLLY